MSDNFLEAVKVSQGCNRGWKINPLNNCESIKWVHVFMIDVREKIWLYASGCEVFGMRVS